jgi:cellulose synthase operon protein C
VLVPVNSELLAFLVWGALAAAAAAQEPSSKNDAGSQEIPSRGAGTVNPAASTRPLPDALKFANGLLRQKKYDLAAEEYERFANSGAKGKDLDDARFGLANARLYQGKYREARQAFDEFLKDAPADPRGLTARYRMGELAYLLGDLPGARKSLEEFRAATSDHAGLEMALTYLGDTYFGLQDFAQARGAYQKSLAAYPQGRLAERAKYGLGRAFAALGDRDRALELMRQLIKQGNPEWTDRAWLQVGLISKSAGRFNEAVEAFSTLERVAPRSPFRAEAQLQRALALVRLERVAEAESLLRTLATDGGASQGAFAALELATIELERSHPDDAMKTLELGLKRFPDSQLLPALNFRAAEVLEKQDRLEAAQARFEKMAGSAPNDPWADDALERAARVALKRGDLAGTRRLAGTFATRFPRSQLKAEVRLIEARAAAQEGKHDEAVALLKSLIAPPTDATKKADGALPTAVTQAARYELALSYRALGQNALADPLLAGLAKEASGAVAADAKFLVGQSHLTAGRFAEAVPMLESYLKARPKGDVADVALAHVVAARLGQNQLDLASKALTELAGRFPRSQSLASTRLRVAEAALAAHQAERAAEQFRLVAAEGTMANEPAKPKGTKPEQPADAAIRARALAGLGKAYRELGKPAEAAAVFASMLELAPTDPMAPEVALARARALEADKQVDAAIKAYSVILEKFPKSNQGPQAALAQARLFAQADRTDEAVRAFERVADDQTVRESLQSAGITPDAVLSEWGWVLVDADKPADSDRVFARLLKEYPNSPHAADARFNLAESANLARNYAEVVRLLTPLTAAKLVEAGAAANPAETKGERGTPGPSAKAASSDSLRRLLPAVLYRLGRSQAELKDWTGAVTTLDRLLADFPDNPYRRDAQYLRAESALRNGDAAAAEKGFAALLAEPPGANDPKGMLPAVRIKRIQCWVALKRWKDALESAQAEKLTLATGDPARAELDYMTGQALLGLGQIEKARAAFQAVLDARKDGELAAQAQLMRGETYFHQDQFHEALRDFLKVDILHDAPRWQAAALLEAGKVYERLDQWADAAETYKRLLSAFSKEPSAAEAQQRLEAATRRSASKTGGTKG